MSSPSPSPPRLPIGPNQPWLAPLAGFSDLPFRLLCREMGCAAACTEMISAKGLLYHSSGTWDLLRTCSQDHPLVVQLFGAEAEVIAEAVSGLKEMGFSFFDLNAGCPVKKVVKTGAGAALLHHPPHLCKVLSAMVDVAGPGRVGVKLRSGVTSGTEVLSWIQGLDSLGLGWVSLHPRTVRQGYAGRADWQVLDAVSRKMQLPVLASGDLISARDGLHCMQSTQAGGLMFARGALADPGIFAAYLKALKDGEEHSREEKDALVRTLRTARRHIELTREHGRGDHELLRMRTIIPRYMRGFPGVKHVRQRVVACRTWSELVSYLDQVEMQSAQDLQRPSNIPHT
ncbi:tRNA dihydrouridine synthase [Desulfovermiculus halophilus]|uniref:tRNA dihydrouridine synthase n=1 Tax=Desulfovermiculus halophilus TaxID=339722 RepID=UPI00055819A5|nr:tRNA-dihydrouridine synthase family protein [Desulfovermiculus halophilus]